MSSLSYESVYKTDRADFEIPGKFCLYLLITRNKYCFTFSSFVIDRLKSAKGLTALSAWSFTTCKSARVCWVSYLSFIFCHSDGSLSMKFIGKLNRWKKVIISKNVNAMVSSAKYHEWVPNFCKITSEVVESVLEYAWMREMLCMQRNVHLNC